VKERSIDILEEKTAAGKRDVVKTNIEGMTRNRREWTLEETPSMVRGRFTLEIPSSRKTVHAKKQCRL
jgi:hypothetical protein